MVELVSFSRSKFLHAKYMKGSFVANARGRFFHRKGAWGYAAHKCTLFWTSSLVKGILFGNFRRFYSGRWYAFWQFWSKKCQTSVIPAMKYIFLNFGPENAKILASFV